MQLTTQQQRRAKHENPTQHSQSYANGLEQVGQKFAPQSGFGHIVKIEQVEGELADGHWQSDFINASLIEKNRIEMIGKANIQTERNKRKDDSGFDQNQRHSFKPDILTNHLICWPSVGGCWPVFAAIIGESGFTCPNYNFSFLPKLVFRMGRSSFCHHERRISRCA